MKFTKDEVELQGGFKLKKHGYLLKIDHDETPESPEEWLDDNEKLVSFNSRYGDSHGFEDPTEVREYAKENKLKCYPVFCYDHSGLAFSLTNSRYPFNDRWDAGFYGFLVTKQTQKQAQAWLENYQSYANGWVYGFTLEKIKHCKTCKQSTNEVIDSCWGFYEIENLLDHVNSNFKN